MKKKVFGLVLACAIVVSSMCIFAMAVATETDQSVGFDNATMVSDAVARGERLQASSSGGTIDLLAFSSGQASTESTSDTTETIITDHPTNGEGRIDHFIFEPNPGTDDSLSDVPDNDTKEPIITDHPTNGEGRIDHVIFWPDYETNETDEQDVQ